MTTGTEAGTGLEGPRCHAPFTSAYLDQRGFVRVCAMNGSAALGNVATDSLWEIWHGERAKELRRRFGAGGWGVGCNVCAWQAGSSPEQAFARVYDDLPLPDDEPEWPIHLELAMGNTCNLQCVMCSGEQSSAIRRNREHFPPIPAAYPDRFFDELTDVLPHLQRVKFLGGEPFLIPAHHRVFDLMIDGGLGTPIHVTTNATIWTDRVERVLHHLPTSLAVSIDGIRPDTVAKIRVGADLTQILANLDRFQDYTRERGTYLGLTYCLMTENWQEFADFLAFADARDLDVYVNTVTTPAALSLYRIPEPALIEIVTALEARDPWAQTHLDRNLHVWNDQLGRLRSRLGGDAGEPVWLRPSYVQFPELRVPNPPRVSADEDVRVMQEWAGDGPVALLELDTTDEVICNQPGEGRFLDLPTDVTGRTFGEVAMMLVSYYGRTSDWSLVTREPGLVDRVATHETQDVVTKVRFRTRASPDGDAPGCRVVVAVRPPSS